MKKKFANEFAVGIIDNDKKQHSYVDDFTRIRKTGHIELLKHTDRPHYIIRVSPAIERFLLDIASSDTLHKFGLPSQLKELTGFTKSLPDEIAKKIERLTKVLCSNEKSEMSTLKRILEYLNQHKYQVCLKTLETI